MKRCTSTSPDAESFQTILSFMRLPWSSLPGDMNRCSQSRTANPLHAANNPWGVCIFPYPRETHSRFDSVAEAGHRFSKAHRGSLPEWLDAGFSMCHAIVQYATNPTPHLIAK